MLLQSQSNRYDDTTTVVSSVLLNIMYIHYVVTFTTFTCLKFKRTLYCTAVCSA